MFGLFSPAPKRALPRQQPLFIERLEDRDCPTTISLTATPLQGHQVRLEGYVSDGPLPGVLVNFSGAAMGIAVSDQTGYFSITTFATSLGSVYADGMDIFQQSTNTAVAQIKVVPPKLNLTVLEVANNQVVLQGHVDALDQVNLAIMLSGTVSTTVTTDANGDFTLTACPDALGEIYATVQDPWGQISQAVVSLASNVPTILDFTCVPEIGNMWTFSGRVADEHAAGMTVSFGGLPSLLGKTATVNADGTFSFTIELQPGEEGTATAWTCDWWGQLSETVCTFVG